MDIAQICEFFMLFAFGFSWPFAIARTYKSGHSGKGVAGKSPMFMIIILFGYVGGICARLFDNNPANNWLGIVYVIDMLLVSTDLALYLYYSAKSSRQHVMDKINPGEAMKDVLKLTVFCSSLVAAAAMGETISVPAGETMKVEPGRVFTGEMLVKTGAGTLDLTGAHFKNAGLEIREGAVKVVGGGATAVTTRYLKWNVTKTRPGKKGYPEFADSGSQFSEFCLFLGGKKLPRPQNATARNATGGREGPEKGIDGNVKTKCLFNPFIADFGEEVTFDGYSFITANDAIARDPYSWIVEVGIPDGSAVNWMYVGSVEKFEAPKERFTDAGKIFPVSLRDVIPPNYPVTICGKGRLILVGVNETLERVKGNGLIEVEGASVDFGADAAFAGTVAGGGSVTYKKR